MEIRLLLMSLRISSLFPDDSKFSEAVQTLLTWIERGEVNRRSANNFYSMIQSANSHVRRLVNEKAAHEKDMEEAKEKFKQALSGILIQCEWKSEFCWKDERALHLVITLSRQEPGLQSHPVSRSTALFITALCSPYIAQCPSSSFTGIMYALPVFIFSGVSTSAP